MENHLLWFHTGIYYFKNIFIKNNAYFKHSTLIMTIYKQDQKVMLV